MADDEFGTLRPDSAPLPQSGLRATYADADAGVLNGSSVGSAHPFTSMPLHFHFQFHFILFMFNINFIVTLTPVGSLPTLGESPSHNQMFCLLLASAPFELSHSNIKIVSSLMVRALGTL